jgi:NAD(P)-dependent dehydrogenase (short-subunit alcohol dehydrogenase family)
VTRVLAGRVARVTGGATGMGRAIAVRLARAGADVAIGSPTAAVHGDRVERETALEVDHGTLAEAARAIEAEKPAAFALHLCRDERGASRR